MCSRIRRIVIMGGSIGLGNRTPAVELNIWGRSRGGLRLEVTHSAMFTRDNRSRLEDAGSERARCIANVTLVTEIRGPKIVERMIEGACREG